MDEVQFTNDSSMKTIEPFDTTLDGMRRLKEHFFNALGLDSGVGSTEMPKSNRYVLNIHGKVKQTDRPKIIAFYSSWEGRPVDIYFA